MKIAVLVIRILFGGLLIFSSLNYFFQFTPMQMPEGEVQKFMIGISATVYMFPLIKIIELVAGIAIISGFFVPLATVVIFPITLNILLFNLFMTPEGAPVGIFVIAANLFLAYYFRGYYKPLFESGRKFQTDEKLSSYKMRDGLKENLG
jgi:putative oxidoreductase